MIIKKTNSPMVKPLKSFLYTGLMSVYKKEDTNSLNDSLNSILNQTVKPTYFVLIKDGPLGLNLEKVISKQKKKFKSNDIEFIELRNKQNMGLGYSLNKGVKECPTELVARFDSDDLYNDKRMEKTISFYQSNPDFVLVGTQISEFNGNISNKIAVRSVPLSLSKIKKQMVTRNPFNHTSVTFRKSAVESVGNYEDVNYFEDYYLWMKLVKNDYLVANLPDILVNVRVNDDFVNRRGGIKYFFDEINFQKKMFKYGFLNPFQFVRNILLRGGSRLLPKKILLHLYKLLRSN